MSNPFARGARIGDYIIEDTLVARAPELAFRARHGILPRVVRIVTLANETDRTAAVRLLREACVLEALQQAGVPRVFECGVVRHVPWIATELIKGTPVRQGGTSEALALVRDTAAILAAAHDRGIVHRNLTPELIVRTKTGATYITSWGDAAVGLDDPPLLAITGRTRYYRAPELAAAGPCDGRADVFSLGAIAYEVMTGSVPLLSPVRFPHIPSAVHSLLARMLAPVPEDRPSMADVRAEAARLAELYTDGGPVIEEVEVELVDIGQLPQPSVVEGRAHQ